MLPLLQDLISIFNDSELELLVCGLPEIDTDDLRANTEYTGYTPSSAVVQYFWEVSRCPCSAHHSQQLLVILGPVSAICPWPILPRGAAMLHMCLSPVGQSGQQLCWCYGLPCLLTAWFALERQRLSQHPAVLCLNPGVIRVNKFSGHVQVVRELDKEDLALLLQFVTGTSKVPLDGFKALQVRC